MKPRHNDLVVYEAVKTGQFEIMDDGSIWRLAHRKGPYPQPLHPMPRRRAETEDHEYLRVRVTINSRTYIGLAHRLVWMHFNGPIPGDLTINHIDGVKTNNHPANLELATTSEQALHSFRILGRKPLSGEVHPSAKLTQAQVTLIRKRLAKGHHYGLYTALGREFGVTYQTIADIHHGNNWQQSVFPASKPADWK